MACSMENKSKQLYYLIRTDFYDDEELVEYTEGPYPLATARVRERELLSLKAVPRSRSVPRTSCRVRMEKESKKRNK
jgi:hypothetical protein